MEAIVAFLVGFWTAVSLTFGFGAKTEKLPDYMVNSAPVVATQTARVLPSTKQSNMNISADTEISVEGMKKFTDEDFGFSFWYPSGWTIVNMSEKGRGMFAGSTDRSGNLMVGRIYVRAPDVEIYIDKIHSDERTYYVNPGACGYCGPVTYFFDPTLHLWMKQYPMGLNGAPDATPDQIEASKIPQPADISRNTMGGLHMFRTEQKESAVIVPLSARNFLYIRDETYTQLCGGSCASNVKGGAGFLANTIVATDPSVAVPLGKTEQKAVIEAEKAAYVGL